MLVFRTEVAILLSLCLLIDLAMQRLSLWDCISTCIPAGVALIGVCMCMCMCVWVGGWVGTCVSAGDVCVCGWVRVGGNVCGHVCVWWCVCVVCVGEGLLIMTATNSPCLCLSLVCVCVCVRGVCV